MRVIIYTDKKTGEVQCFSSLKPFFEKFPEFEEKRENVNTHLSRKKVAFETDSIKIARVEVQS